MNSDIQDSRIDTSPCRRIGLKQLIDLQIPRDFNLAAKMLGDASMKWEDKPCLVGENHIISFSQLKNLANKAGNLLLGCGVSIEQRVLIMTHDSTSMAALILGAIKIGAVPVPLSKNFHSYELRYLIHDIRANTAIIDPDMLEEVQELTKGTSWLRNIILTKPMETTELKSLPEELKYASPELAAAPTTADDTAFWIYTAGSAGFPKAAVHMHRNPICSCKTFAEDFIGLNENDVILSVHRMTEAQGVMNSIFFPLHTGAKSIITSNKPNSKELIELITTHEVTVLFGTPDTYEDLLKEAENQHITEFPSLRLCISTREKLDPAIGAKWQERFKSGIVNGFSTTEALHIMICNDPAAPRQGTIGKVIPGYEARIEKPDGQPAAPGEVGDLLIRGESAAACYWNRYKSSTVIMLGEWMKTGDKCRYDNEGFIYYLGRAAEMLCIDGNWISPVSTEQALEKLPWVKRSAVVTEKDEHDADRLKAYIILNDGYEPSPELAGEIRMAANKDMPIYLQVKKLEFVPDLPVAPDGKLLRYKLAVKN
ncbi:MAG: AMP-binding protein [bacterium]|nr:AMP-binding protein [bacterium]